MALTARSRSADALYAYVTKVIAIFAQAKVGGLDYWRRDGLITPAR